jgi:tetratricopeptide (TPR) repeat protein
MFGNESTSGLSPPGNACPCPPISGLSLGDGDSFQGLPMASLRLPDRPRRRSRSVFPGVRPHFRGVPDRQVAARFDMMRPFLEEVVIEIYDINNGKLKYSAYTFWQLCEMVVEDFAYHTADKDNDVVDWIEEKARKFSSEPRRHEVRERLRRLLQFGEKEDHLAFACRISLVLGKMESDVGQHESAIEYFEKSVSLEPQHVEALHQLARAFAATGQYEKAIEALRKANGVSPAEETYLALADVLAKLKRPKDQERTLRSLLRNCPRSIRGMHQLAQLCRRHKRHKPAARLVQQIVDLRPEDNENFVPFFEEFADALIWSKYNYEARRVNRILECLDEEQKRSPDERLSLLKAVMLYKLDKRICREECCCELRKYFEGIGWEKAIVTKDLRQLVETFGQEFSRGIVRFIKNRFSKLLQQRDGQKPSLLAAPSPSATGHSVQRDPSAEGQSLCGRASFWDGRLPEDVGSSN